MEVLELTQQIVDNRKYEQIQANMGAVIYDRAISSEWDYRYNYLTTYSWAKRFNETFLDFGCGTGLASKVFERMGKQVVAFDISREMLRFAKKRCNVPLVLADALNLPFRNKAFSTTCIIGVLHHILDLEKAFAEIARCTKEVICINEPCPKPSIAMKLLLIAAYYISVVRGKAIGFVKDHSSEKGSYRSKYERPLEPEMLVQLCNKYGFKVVQLRYFNHIPLLHEFLSEKSRSRLFAALVSSASGTDVEILAVSSRQRNGGDR